MRYLTGAFFMSLILLAWHVKLRHIVYGLFERGDSSDFGHTAKLPTYRYYGERLAHE